MDSVIHSVPGANPTSISYQVDIKLANISMSVMKKKFQTNPLDHLDHSLQGDILKLEALEEEKKNKHKARNEASSFRWSNSLVEVELPDQVFSLHHSNQWHYHWKRWRWLVRTTRYPSPFPRTTTSEI